MEQIYQINPQLDIPIYRQLVDSITAAVKRGALSHGQQLPTVQELSDQLGLAKGTVKRAYDELCLAGIVEKVQGRGTFVRYQPANSESRKEQAMAVIDTMLNTLEAMDLSPSEISIFLNLKLRDRAQQESSVKVAVVECNPENLSHLTEQLHRIPGVDLYAHLVESIEQYPYRLDESMELIVTTAAHAGFLENILPVRRRMARVALRLEPACLARIIRLRRGQQVGILGYSMRFSQLLYSTCLSYNEGVVLHSPVTFADVPDLQAYLQGKDAVLVPHQYEKYCSAAVAAQLDRFGGKVIACSYEMDEGSFLYLQEKIKRLLAEKAV